MHLSHGLALMAALLADRPQQPAANVELRLLPPVQAAVDTPPAGRRQRRGEPDASPPARAEGGEERGRGRDREPEARRDPEPRRAEPAARPRSLGEPELKRRRPDFQ